MELSDAPCGQEATAGFNVEVSQEQSTDLAAGLSDANFASYEVIAWMRENSPTQQS